MLTAEVRHRAQHHQQMERIAGDQM
jgi:hypothetical protein